MSDVFICPKCKGNREVFNPECLFLTVVIPLAFFMEHDEEASNNTFTKKPCPTCRGRGFIKFEDDDDDDD